MRMSHELEGPNFFENALLRAAAEEFSKDYPDIDFKTDLLQVTSRENSGVGSFTNFEFDIQPPSINSIGRLVLSSKLSVKIPKLKLGLGFVIFTENGKVVMLETFTYDENWDGNWLGFRIEPLTNSK